MEGILVAKKPQDDPVFKQFVEVFENLVVDWKPQMRPAVFNSNKIQFDLDSLSKCFYLAYEQNQELEGQLTKETIPSNHPFRNPFEIDPDTFSDHLKQRFNTAIQKLKMDQSQTSPSGHWKSLLESKASFTFVEAAEIAGESERTIRDKIQQKGCPLTRNPQGRNTQKSLKLYLDIDD